MKTSTFFSLLMLSTACLFYSCSSHSDYKGEWVIESVVIQSTSEAGLAGTLWANLFAQGTSIDIKQDVVIINHQREINYKISNGMMIFESGDTLSYEVTASTLTFSNENTSLNLVKR